jgi:hypothetical protein
MDGQVICWIIAGVLFILGAFWTPRPGWSLTSVGLAFLTLGFLIPLV